MHLTKPSFRIIRLIFCYIKYLNKYTLLLYTIYNNKSLKVVYKKPLKYWYDLKKFSIFLTSGMQLMLEVKFCNQRDGVIIVGLSGSFQVMHTVKKCEMIWIDEKSFLEWFADVNRFFLFQCKTYYLKRVINNQLCLWFTYHQRWSYFKIKHRWIMQICLWKYKHARENQYIKIVF